MFERNAYFLFRCASLPCQNGATCNNGINYYSCNCLPGFFGINCQEITKPCISVPCQNNGTCIDFKNGLYQCYCAPGYNGTNCDKIKNDCTSNPCLNHGVCNNNNNSPGFKCICPLGYSGTR
jgi:hypothetical protein